MAGIARQTKTAIYDLRDVIPRFKEARVATGPKRSLRHNAEMLAREQIREAVNSSDGQGRQLFLARI